jgi:hypothetical protein
MTTRNESSFGGGKNGESAGYYMSELEGNLNQLQAMHQRLAKVMPTLNRDSATKEHYIIGK